MQWSFKLTSSSKLIFFTNKNWKDLLADWTYPESAIKKINQKVKNEGELNILEGGKLTDGELYNHRESMNNQPERKEKLSWENKRKKYQEIEKDSLFIHKIRAGFRRSNFRRSNQKIESEDQNRRSNQKIKSDDRIRRSNQKIESEDQIRSLNKKIESDDWNYFCQKFQRFDVLINTKEKTKL
jgi:hypothetical protein